MYLLIVCFFFFITLSCYSLLAIPAAKTYDTQKRIQLYLTNHSAPQSAAAVEEEVGSFIERMVKPSWKNVKRKYQKKLNKEKASKLETKILQAGQPMGISPIEFKIIQWFLIALLILLAGASMFLLHIGFLKGVMLLILSVGAGVILPKFYLSSRASKRMATALKELPDTLDLLTISLEAGLGFDAALSKVVSKKKGVLSEEFKLCLEEIRLGRTRREALNDINLRLPLEELRGLIYSIIQAEKLGIGMVTVLKVQTEDIRELRKQKAEEKAMKAPIKMLFPLVLFIFPTLFVVLLGPAILQLMETM